MAKCADRERELRAHNCACLRLVLRLEQLLCVEVRFSVMMLFESGSAFLRFDPLLDALIARFQLIDLVIRSAKLRDHRGEIIGKHAPFSLGGNARARERRKQNRGGKVE